jgi:SPP1 family predicted phage head-tail adaptor
MALPSTGELNRRITILEWQDQPNAQGGIDAQKTPELTVWAKRQAVGAGVYQESVQVEQTITHRFYIRYREDVIIDQNTTIVCEGDEYRSRRLSDLEDKKQFFVIETELLGPYNG